MALSSEDFHRDAGAALLGQTLPALLRAAVDAGPDDTAFVDEHQTWTWLQWLDATEAVARGLQDHGLGRGDVVVAQLPNSWEFLVAHTAVALAGGVLLPVHVGYGPPAVAAMAQRCDARLTISPDAVDVAGLARDFVGARPNSVRVRPDDPFLLLPSSATTSLRPKISMHAHDGLLSNAAAVVAAGGLRRGDSVLSASPFTHLFGLLSVHASLFARTTQLLSPVWDPDRVLALARAASAVVLFAVPTQVRDLIARVDETGEVPRIREVRTGGSKVPAALVDGLRRSCDASVVVQWGMSELGAGLFTSADDPPHVATGSIGRPAPGARCRVVLDGVDCAPGEVGELWMSSPYAFRGYLGDPELTARALPEDGWLRTGDLASLEADGLVAFHGRAAELIDVGGQKFSATEVEELLADLPRLGPAAVAARPDPRLGQYPCLAVTEGSTVTLRDVTEHLAGKGVAEYKIPVELVVLPEIPHTATGKIARRRLADLVDDQPGPPRAVPADSLLELVLAETRAILDGSTPTPGQTFRECGLSSLGAVRLAQRLRAATGLPLTSTIVFDHPTPEALARRLAGGVQPAPTTPRPETPGDPLVIVGMGCRLPGGVSSPEEFWQLLVDERDVMGPAPADRGWPAGEFTGGYLADIAGFDAEFFGIRPAEAAAMDPQQRLLLEVTREALERAGIDPNTLRGTDTGVYVGMFAADYAPRVLESPDHYDGNLLIGNAGGVASGRIAYVLGLHGPAITVDTACSSSLVALHQAAAAIRAGECERAIVAGVTVMCTPATFVDLGQHGLVAPDGRCKPFSDNADGVGWSEAVGVLVVERLSTARRDGHPVLAVVRGSAINSDGASNGLTAPNGTAQRAVIRQALANAGLAADDVQAVEAHGTGTPLGDPIEAQALLDAYGGGIRIGSVKSNIGHTQAAAGVVGVIKMVLAMRHRLLPKTLHAESATAHVDWSDDTVRLLTEATPWPAGPRRAGISSFGIGGTNAHVIIEEPAAVPEIPAQRPKAPAPWLLSAASPDALRAMADRLSDATNGLDPHDVAHTLAYVRSSLDHRAAVLPNDHQAALKAFAAGQHHDDVITGHRVDGRTAFVFTGQGQQWHGMATELARTAPPFAAALRACDEALRRHTGWSVIELMSTEPDRVDVIQAGLFATMASLAALWRDAGVRPDAVVGHSQGEIAAAYVAGALSLEDAAKIVAVRGRLLGEIAGIGAMASVQLSDEEAAEVLAPFGDGVSIAAVNGPRSLVISGNVDDVHRIVAELRSRDVPARAIAVDLASHSAHVDRLLPRLRDELGDIRPRAGDIPFYSTVTGDQVDTRSLTADYWCRNLRDVVDLRGAIAAMSRHGHHRFIEVSAHPVLGDAIEQTAPDAAVIETIRRDMGDLDRFRRSVAHAHVAGVAIGLPPGRLVDLPTYPFQHKRYWHSTPVPAAVGSAVPTMPADLGALVREQVAAVAGRTDVDDNSTFTGLGLSSLAMTELRVRLQRTAGVRLPVVALLDHPTPQALARHLARLTGQSSIVVSTGPQRPRLVCLPSLTPLSGPAEFNGWASRFQGERDVIVVPQPGFVAGEPLPADLDALLDAHAEAVTALGDPGDTVLCGHSSGGWIAHALAGRLAANGDAPAAVALLDAFWPDETFHDDVLPWVWSRFAQLGNPVAANVAAAYRAMMSDWRPGDLDVPMLFVGARQGLRQNTIRAQWPQPCERVVVEGDHFTMMTAHADETAAAVQQWLATYPGTALALSGTKLCRWA